MRKIVMALAMASLSTPAMAGELLWQNIEAGMTIDQVRALYPDARFEDDAGFWGGGRLDIRNYRPIPDCSATARIHFENDAVGAVEVRGAGAYGGRCSSEIEEMLKDKYGEPRESDQKWGGCTVYSCMTQTWLSIWDRGGVVMRYRRLHGQGLVGASWVMEYIPEARLEALRAGDGDVGL